MRKTALVGAAFLSLFFASEAALADKRVTLVQMASLSTTPQESAAVEAPADAPDPAAELRQDYEYAERVGTTQGWESFLKTHPTGFYADLARAQLAKLTIGPAGTSAAAKKAAEDQARLAKEGASNALQAKADVDAKAAALQAKRVAELKKKREEARVAAQAKIASLPAQRAGSNAQPVQQAKAAPRMDRAALWAKCDATISRGNRDDDIQRPGRVEACVRDGGRS